jgi:hypothetical protein
LNCSHDHLGRHGATDFHFGNFTVRTAELSPSRDGRSLAANTLRYHGEIWMIEGLEPPRSFWQRLFHR